MAHISKSGLFYTFGSILPFNIRIKINMNDRNILEQNYHTLMLVRIPAFLKAVLLCLKIRTFLYDIMTRYYNVHGDGTFNQNIDRSLGFFIITVCPISLATEGFLQQEF